MHSVYSQIDIPGSKINIITLSDDFGFTINLNVGNEIYFLSFYQIDEYYLKIGLA